MSAVDALGPAQIAALIVLLQRGLEELYSRRNTRMLLAEGAHEAGRDFYPVVVITHLMWILGLFVLVPPFINVDWLLLALYGGLQVVRYWVIGTLGRFWTHRIITLPGAAVVRSGPYALVRHPNYWVSVTETALLPLVFHSWGIALLMTPIWWAVLRYKAGLEDQGLAEREADCRAQ